MSQIILIADKSITIQKIVELTFQEEDFEVIAASNGKEALEKLDQVCPSIILADISLPEINGYELCRILRNEPKYAKFSKLPVLLLAGIYETMDEQKAKYVEEKSREVESNGVLTKPFDPQDLIQKVKQMSVSIKEEPEKIKEMEEVFQLEEEPRKLIEEHEAEKLEEKIEDDRTVFISDEEKRYIMGMPADKELSPELTGDIFEEQGEVTEFIEEKVELVTPKEEELFLEEVSEAEGTKFEIEQEPVAKISEKEIVESKHEEPVAIEDFIESIEEKTEEKEEAPLILEEDTPLLIEEEVQTVPEISPEEDILGISEMEEKETLLEEGLKTEETKEAEVLESKETLEEVTEGLEEIITEPLEEKEIEVSKLEEVITEDIAAKKEMISGVEVKRELVQEKIDEIVESQLEKVEEPFVEPVAKPEIGEEKEVKSTQITSEMLLSDELIERIAEKVINNISTKVLEEIAWQVVPDLAERIIKSIVEKLKLKDNN